MRTTLTLILSLGLTLPAFGQMQNTDKPAERPKKEVDPKKPVRQGPLTDAQKTEVQRRLLELQSRSWGKRERATRRLIAMGPPIGLMVAEALKKCKDTEAKWRLRKVLKAIGGAHLDAQTLRESLKDKLRPLGNRQLWRWNLRWQDQPMAQGGTPQTQKLLEELKRLGPQAAGAVAIELASDNDKLRVNVAYLLGEIGNPVVCPELIKALGDRSTEVQKMAAWSLGRLRQDTALMPLLALATKTTDKNVQKAAMLSLLPLRSRASIPALISLLGRGGELGWHANWVLEKLTGHRTRYNPFREERRAKGIEGWKAWFAKNEKTFKFAYSGPRTAPASRRVGISSGRAVPQRTVIVKRATRIEKAKKPVQVKPTKKPDEKKK